MFELVRPYLPFFAAALTVLGLARGMSVWRRDNQRRLTRQVGSERRKRRYGSRGRIHNDHYAERGDINDSPKATIVIDTFDVELLWNDPEFDWLPDPAETVLPRSENSLREPWPNRARNLVLRILTRSSRISIRACMMPGKCLGKIDLRIEQRWAVHSLGVVCGTMCPFVL